MSLTLTDAINNWSVKNSNTEVFQGNRSRFKWKKDYISHKEKGYELKTLNIFQRIFRVIFGAYKSTHKKYVFASIDPSKYKDIDPKSNVQLAQVISKVSEFKRKKGRKSRDKQIKRNTCFKNAERLNQVKRTYNPDYRFRNLKATDIGFKRTPQDAVNKIYDTLEVLDSTLRSSNIQYCMSGGTQLGAVRQTGNKDSEVGGLIPWDDDGDIAILKKDLDKLKALKNDFFKRGYELIETKFCWKLQPIDGTPYPKEKEEPGKNGEAVKYPFIDIFVMDKQKDKDQDKYYIANEEALKFWPYEYYTEKEWNKITDVRFGHLTLRGLKGKNAEGYLNRGYFDPKTKQPNWKQFAGRWWDHEEASWLGEKYVDLIDTRHAVRGPVQKVSEVAKGQLGNMTPTEMDNDWKLEELFGHVRYINLKESNDRKEQVLKQLGSVGVKNAKQLEGCYGKFELTDKVIDNCTNNYKKVKDKSALFKQHAGQAGCYFSHYFAILEARENYQKALNNLEKVRAEHKASPEKTTKEDVEIAQKEVIKYSSVLIVEDDNAFGMLNYKDAISGKYNQPIGWYGDITTHKSTKKGAGRILREALSELPEDWDMLYFMSMDFQGGEKDKKFKHITKLKEGVMLNCYAISAKFYDTVIHHLKKIEEDKKYDAVDVEISQLHSKNKCYVIDPSIAFQLGGDSCINGVKSEEKTEMYQIPKVNIGRAWKTENQAI